MGTKGVITKLCSLFPPHGDSRPCVPNRGITQRTCPPFRPRRPAPLLAASYRGYSDDEIAEQRELLSFTTLYTGGERREPSRLPLSHFSFRSTSALSAPAHAAESPRPSDHYRSSGRILSRRKAYGRDGRPADNFQHNEFGMMEISCESAFRTIPPMTSEWFGRSSARLHTMSVAHEMKGRALANVNGDVPQVRLGGKDGIFARASQGIFFGTRTTDQKPGSIDTSRTAGKGMVYDCIERLQGRAWPRSGDSIACLAWAT